MLLTSSSLTRRIKKRLQALGFLPQDIDGEDVQKLKEVREPKLLTDKGDIYVHHHVAHELNHLQFGLESSPL